MVEEKEYPITLLSPEGFLTPSVATVKTNPEDVAIAILVNGVVAFVGSGRDVFEAFARLRGPAEVNGWRFLCAGARRDAWASGMARSMANGSVVWIREGHDAARLVSVFEMAPINLVVTYDEQRQSVLKDLK